jgi:hypothetical protein
VRTWSGEQLLCYFCVWAIFDWVFENLSLQKWWKIFRTWETLYNFSLIIKGHFPARNHSINFTKALEFYEISVISVLTLSCIVNIFYYFLLYLRVKIHREKKIKRSRSVFPITLTDKGKDIYRLFLMDIIVGYLN